MANIHKYTVQEATNLVVPRLIEVTPTTVADDNADNDVAFNWVEVADVTGIAGGAVKLISVSIYDPGVALGDLELFFCRGSGSSGTAPTTAQNLQDGAAGSAVADITAAEATAIVVCGSCVVNHDHAEGLLTCGVQTNSNLSLVMAPASSSTSLYVAGMWRSNPAEGANTSMTMYFGFEG